MTPFKLYPLIFSLFIIGQGALAIDTEALTETMDQANKLTTAPIDKNLIQLTMAQLGITQSQAKGGLGSLLSMAKMNLGNQKFAPIAKSIPNIDELLATASALNSIPKQTSNSSTEMTNSHSPSLKDKNSIDDTFIKLGLPKGFVDPMMDILENYLHSYGTKEASDALMRALTPLTVTQDPLDLK